MTDDAVRALTALGFTALEAEVYTFLLRESPATGYRVAQGIARPVANTYKAIESLALKGAVQVEEGASRLCRAVPAEELLAQLEQSFRRRQQDAVRALAELRGAPDDDRVYQLRTREQVIERCRAMLRRSRHLVLVDLFERPLELLRDDLSATAHRGIEVVAKVYRRSGVPGVQVILNPRGEEIMAAYPGQWIVLAVDGAELLIACFTPDGRRLQQAIWSGSAYLSWIIHSSMSAEFVLADALTTPEVEPHVMPLVRKWRAIFSWELPGFQHLRHRFQAARPAVPAPPGPPASRSATAEPSPAALPPIPLENTE